MRKKNVALPWKYIALSFARKKKGIVTSKTYLYHSSNCWSFSTISDAFFTLEHRSRVEEDDFTFYLWYLIGRNATRTADIDRRTRLSDWFVSFPQRKDPPWWNNLTSKRKGKRVKKKKSGKGNGENAPGLAITNGRKKEPYQDYQGKVMTNSCRLINHKTQIGAYCTRAPLLSFLHPYFPLFRTWNICQMCQILLFLSLFFSIAVVHRFSKFFFFYFLPHFRNNSFPLSFFSGEALKNFRKYTLPPLLARIVQQINCRNVSTSG